MSFSEDKSQEIEEVIESLIGDIFDPLTARLSEQIFETLLNRGLCRDALLIGVEQAIANSLPESERCLFINRFEVFRSEL